MAYYYVKSGGTATGNGGRYASKQTGTFAGLGASGYYSTLAGAYAATTAPTSGDFVCVSNSHTETTTSLTVSGPTSGGAIFIVTVSDTAIDTSVAAGSSQFATTNTQIIGRHFLYGLYISVDNDFSPGTTGASNSTIYMEKCTISPSGTTDNFIYMPQDSQTVRAIECTFIGGDANTRMELLGGGYLDIRGSSFSGVTEQLTNGGFVNGGGTLRVTGCDLSSITGTLIKDVGNSSTIDDTIDVFISNCKLSASLTGYTNETFENYGQRVTVVGSGSGAAAEYQYHTVAYGGTVDESTTIYRDSATPFPSGQKISLKAVTDSNASKGLPFWFDFPTRFVDLPSASSNVLSLYILSASTLTNVDVWASLYYADGTNIHISNVVTSQQPPLATGAALTTNSESWTGYTSQNRYQIDLDTSVDPGSACVPTIRVYIGKPSATIYICPTIGLS